MRLFDLYCLWPAKSFCVLLFLAGLRAPLDAKTVFRSSLPCKKLLNSLLEKTGQVLRECPERGQWPGARASGCGESRNGGRWVSRDHPHPPRPRWAKGANQLGATHMWDCHTRSGEAFSNLGYILLNLGHTLPNLSKKLPNLSNILSILSHILSNLGY